MTEKYVFEDSEEMSQFIREHLADRLESWIDEDSVKRIVTHVAHTAVMKKLDDMIEGKMQSIIEENLIKVINDLSSFTVFNNGERSGLYRYPATKGYRIIEDLVEKHKDLIEKVVLRMLVPDEDKQTLIEWKVADAIERSQVTINFEARK